MHTDEVYFRDTAHGFLAWAVASLVTAALLGSAISGVVSGGAQAGATMAAGATAALGTGASAVAGAAGRDGESGASAYFVDALFRGDAIATASATPVGGGAPPIAEAARIFASGIQAGALPQDDARYLGRLVAQRTGLAQPEADKRVTDNFTRLQTTLRDTKTAALSAADSARKASAYGALWLFVSLLSGAFIASLTATFGGRRRDA